ncbi:hypothetical protein RF11_14077 [Thelohanellus kitauei]|uniref:C2H2-type domain-containing protein n=1 Tax=Thelohanellus kitauei TaxID=669202 RepID=A0A0C2MDD3_THEKT|nr:hypothetical protein RF11_14077 [Thelohanellus kitauei]
MYNEDEIILDPASNKIDIENSLIRLAFKHFFHSLIRSEKPERLDENLEDDNEFCNTFDESGKFKDIFILDFIDINDPLGINNTDTSVKMPGIPVTDMNNAQNKVYRVPNVVCNFTNEETDAILKKSSYITKSIIFDEELFRNVEYKQNRRDKKYHYLTHLGITAFKCTFENCDRRFVQKKALDLHVKTNKHERFKCPICDYITTELNDMYIHTVQHSETKNYPSI